LVRGEDFAPANGTIIPSEVDTIARPIVVLGLDPNWPRALYAPVAMRLRRLPPGRLVSRYTTDLTEMVDHITTKTPGLEHKTFYPEGFSRERLLHEMFFPPPDLVLVFAVNISRDGHARHVAERAYLNCSPLELHSPTGPTQRHYMPPLHPELRVL